MRQAMTIEARAAHLAEIRDRAIADMAGIGVTRDFIDLLVETFYARIRTHPTLGPVFSARLEGRWDVHLPKMKRFWGAIAFKDGNYGGKPVAAHQDVDGIVPPLFMDWLMLFDETLADIAPTPEARAWFMVSANRIARSMMSALFADRPETDEPRGEPSA